MQSKNDLLNKLIKIFEQPTYNVRRFYPWNCAYEFGDSKVLHNVGALLWAKFPIKLPCSGEKEEDLFMEHREIKTILSCN